MGGRTDEAKAGLLLRFFLLLATFGTEAFGGSWFVDGSVTESGDGRTWDTAFRAIREGMLASSAGDSVVVARGTCAENVHLHGKNIVLRSTDPLNPDVVASTIIDGNQLGSVVTFDGTENESCALSGFIIRNGKASRGGRILGGDDMSATHATIEHNVVKENQAEYDGGGLCDCDGLIRNNTIVGNSASRGGGLLLCGGAIRNNAITGNWANDTGGGFRIVAARSSATSSLETRLQTWEGDWLHATA